MGWCVCVLYSEQRKTVSVSVNIGRVHNDRDLSFTRASECASPPILTTTQDMSK